VDVLGVPQADRGRGHPVGSGDGIAGSDAVRPIDPRLLRLVPRARLGLALTAALSAARAALAVTQALVLGHVLALGFTGSGVAPLRGDLLLLALTLLGRGGLGAAQDVVSRRGAASVKAGLRVQVLDRVGQLGPSWISTRRSGEIATLLGSGLDALDGWFCAYLPQLVLASIVPLTVVTTLLFVDLQAAVLVAVMLPLLPIFLALVGMHTKAQTAGQWRELAQLGGHVLDVVRGLPTLRVFGRAGRQVEVLRTLTERHRVATMRTLRTAFLSSLVLELVATLAVAVLAVSVGFRLLAGQVTFETALVVLLLVPEAFLPLRAVGTSFHAAMDAVTAFDVAFEILQTGLPTPTVRRSCPTRVSVTLDKVTVRHPDRHHPVLLDVDLVLEVGETVALIGPSGSGKSTLLAVVLGLVVPDEGQMLIGGTNLRDVDLEAWRRQLAWVPQRPHLFAGTIADNLRLGRPDATDEQVRLAAQDAEAESFIEDLPRGFDTVLGEGGQGLSLGEQRRIAVARAFLRDAPVLVLDEPTAGLDVVSEAAVARAVARLAVGRTVLLATHRYTHLLPAQRQVRVDRGRVLYGALT
jgi:ATP-binding cassette subfamily C protein CydD